MSSIQEKQRGCVLLLVLVLAGCSGSKEILDASSGRTVTDEVSGALQLVVLPAVERLAAFSPVNQPAPPRDPSREHGTVACANFDSLCLSGGFEVCGAGPEEPVVFRYDRCARPGLFLDGIWALSQKGLLATAEFDLVLDDLSLAGRIGYRLDDMCWRKEFDSFTATREGYSARIDGTVDYCLAGGAGSGRLRVEVTGPTGPFDLVLELDRENGTAAVSRGELTAVCRFEAANGVAACEID